MADTMELKFDPKEFLSNLDLTEKKAYDGATRGLRDCLDELVRISSEISPIDKGILQRSHTVVVDNGGGDVTGSVEYSVKEQSGKGKQFNYALWIHEGDYHLGEQSLKRPGTTGWSGTSYNVGNKYLERPLKGEEEKFYDHIAEEVKKELGD